MFSQNAEEKVILERLAATAPEARRFLDIGAHDGVKFSNTRALALSGWSGVLVEPSAWAAQRLLDLYGGDGRYQIVQAALGLTDGLVRWHDCAEGQVATMAPAHQRLWEQKVRADHGGYRAMLMPQISWRTLIEAAYAGAPGPTMISLDVEGMNRVLLRSAPWERLEAVRLIVVEKDSPEVRIPTMDLLKAQGFAIVHENPENLIGVR